MMLAKGLYKFIGRTILLAVFVCPAHDEVVLLSVQQNLTFGNCTLGVEDEDFQARLVGSVSLPILNRLNWWSLSLEMRFASASLCLGS
jgi:hypothetical protein